jgi:hypothetical protein
MAELKTRPQRQPVAEFIRGIEDPKIRRDCDTLRKLMARVTGKRAVIWGDAIVGFGRYQYKYDSGHSGEFFVTGFSPRKQNLTIYIMPGFNRYKKQLAKVGKHKLGKSCLYVKNLDQVDLAALEEMIADSVRRMREMYVTDVKG